MLGGARRGVAGVEEPVEHQTIVNLGIAVQGGDVVDDVDEPGFRCHAITIGAGRRERPHTPATWSP